MSNLPLVCQLEIMLFSNTFYIADSTLSLEVFNETNNTSLADRGRAGHDKRMGLYSQPSVKGASRINAFILLS